MDGRVMMTASINDFLIRYEIGSDQLSQICSIKGILVYSRTSSVRGIIISLTDVRVVSSRRLNRICELIST